MDGNWIATTCIYIQDTSHPTGFSRKQFETIDFPVLPSKSPFLVCRVLGFQGPELRDSLQSSKGTTVYSRANANVDFFGKVIQEGIIDSLDPQNIFIDIERV